MLSDVYRMFAFVLPTVSLSLYSHCTLVQLVVVNGVVCGFIECSAEGICTLAAIELALNSVCIGVVAIAVDCVAVTETVVLVP